MKTKLFYIFLGILVLATLFVFNCSQFTDPINDEIEKYKTDTYTVTFNSQGGTEVPSQNVNYAGLVSEPTDPTRSGYSFDGWYKEADCTTAWNFAIYMVTENVTIYAKWVPLINHYTITFDKNHDDATGDMPDQSIANGSSENLLTCAFTKPSSTFIGWATDSIGDVVYADGASYTMGAANVTLYAKWINRYTVTFDSQGGSTVSSQDVNDGEKASEPTDPNRTGYSFGGWYKESGCTNVWNFTSDTVTANVTIYAKWTIKSGYYTITFDINDTGATGTMPEQAIEGGSPANLIACGFTKPGWTFDGWAATAIGDPVYPDQGIYGISYSNIILYAKWTANNYTITFDKNDTGAIGEMDVQTIACGSSADLTACTFTKTAWTFDGWATSADGSVVYEDKESYTMGPTDVTLYAKWSPNYYTITFYKNDDDATGDMDDQSIATGSCASLTPCSFTKPGWSFAGWAITAEGNIAYIDQGSYTMEIGDVELFAKWIINDYTVTFNSQGGSAVSSQSINYGGLASEPTNPTRTGYTFGGWYKEAACNNAWNFSSDTVTADVTIYAKWMINSYTVTFNSQGGSAVSSQNVNYGGLASEPTNPNRTGYTFGGWYKEASCNNLWNFTSDTVTANVTIYAKWIINSYTVTFNSQSGSAVSSQNVNYGGLASEPTNPTRTGYTFGGWYKESGCINIWNFTSDTVTANVTIYAQWTINSYTVTFNSQGGSAVSSQNVNCGGLVSEPTNPTRTGYSFDGWYKEADCTNIWNFTSDTVTANVAIYAKWTANNYTITFNKNDTEATGTMDNQTIASGSSANLTTCGFTKTDWSFAGWAITAGGSVVYANQGTYTMGTTNVILYAKWIDLSPIQKRDVVSITGGIFNQKATSGSPDNFDHTISDFQIGKYEVTYELWYTVHNWALSNGYNFANPGREGRSGTITDPAGEPPTSAKYEPVTKINWRDAIVWCNAYSEMDGFTPCYTYSSTVIKDSRDTNATACDNAVCNWSANGYRLPTEGEWQYTASDKGNTPCNYASGATADYNDADETKKVAWYSANSGHITHNVGTTTNSSALTLWDMSGNVWEWCWDWHEDYPSTAQTDYRGADSGHLRITRSGNLSIGALYLQVGYRMANPPQGTQGELGLRVARTN